MELDTGTTTVLAEITDGVGVVTLNRPERRNALHAEMYVAVPPVLERFIEDPDVGCIVITGAGGAFCAGGDVRDGGGRRQQAEDGAKANGEGDDADLEPPRRLTVEEAGTALTRSARMVELLHGSPKVTIAVLPGAAVGAGLGIALSTDLRIAARSARLIPGWGRLGFSGDFGGPWFLTRLVGPSKALELYLDNTTIDAEAAQALGLVNKVVDDDDLAAASMTWARSIASGSQTAQHYFKANVLQAEHLSLTEALPLESERMARSGTTEEHRRAVKAWMAEAGATSRPAASPPATERP